MDGGREGGREGRREGGKHLLVVVQREDEGEGRKSLLPSGKIGNILPALLGRADREDNACEEGREGGREGGVGKERVGNIFLGEVWRYGIYSF